MMVNIFSECFRRMVEMVGVFAKLRTGDHGSSLPQTPQRQSKPNCGLSKRRLCLQNILRTR